MHTFWSVTFTIVIWGHLRLPVVFFLLITHDWKEVGTWAFPIVLSCHDSSTNMLHNLRSTSGIYFRLVSISTDRWRRYVMHIESFERANSISCEVSSMKHFNSNMTYLDHNVTLTWVQMLTWPLQLIMQLFRRASTRGTRWRPNYGAKFHSSRGICENHFCQK